MNDQNVVLTLSERWERMVDSEREAVSALHCVLQNAKDYPEDYADPVQFIEDAEHTLQGLWKFSRDSNFHTHWLHISGCRCPIMKNREAFGLPKIFHEECKWHGSKKNV